LRRDSGAGPPGVGHPPETTEVRKTGTMKTFILRRAKAVEDFWAGTGRSQWSAGFPTGFTRTLKANRQSLQCPAESRLGSRRSGRATRQPKQVLIAFSEFGLNPMIGVGRRFRAGRLKAAACRRLSAGRGCCQPQRSRLGMAAVFFKRLSKHSIFTVDKVNTVGYGVSAFAELRRDQAGMDSGSRSSGCSLT